MPPHWRIDEATGHRVIWQSRYPGALPCRPKTLRPPLSRGLPLTEARKRRRHCISHAAFEMREGYRLGSLVSVKKRKTGCLGVSGSAAIETENVRFYEEST